MSQMQRVNKNKRELEGKNGQIKQFTKAPFHRMCFVLNNAEGIYKNTSTFLFN